MTPVIIGKDYTLVIDTDQFVGSFYEGFCAYCTGMCGESASDQAVSLSDMFYLEHDIEDDEKETADDKNPFSEWIVDKIEPDGTDYSPCVIWPSRKYGANTHGKYAELTEKNFDEYNFPAGFSIGIYFFDQPPQELLDELKERADKFFTEIYPKLCKEPKSVKIEGFRMIVHTKTAEEMAV